MATIASVQISVDENQSRVGPRSIIIWKADTATVSEAKPKKSSRLVSPPRSLCMKTNSPANARTADRQVDVEHPAPGEIVGQPAAQHGAEDRSQDHRGAPQGHDLSDLLGREEIEHDRLRHRDQRRAEQPLEQAEDHDLAQAVGDAAQHRGDGEAADGDHQQLLSADAAREPSGQRRHDRRGDQVGGEHPGDLVGRGADRPLDVRQGDVGDGRVERVHHRRQHHGDGDRPAVLDVLRRRHRFSARRCGYPP